MAIVIEFHEPLGVIELVFPDAFALEELYAALARCMQLSTEHSCKRFLVDTSAIAQQGDSFDILHLAEQMASMPPGSIEREAILPPADQAVAGDFRFFETAARNRGLNVRVMTSRDEALAWLTA